MIYYLCAKLPYSETNSWSINNTCFLSTSHSIEFLASYVRVQNSSASISFIVLTYFLLYMNIHRYVYYDIYCQTLLFSLFFSRSHSDERLITNLIWTCEWGERGKSGQMTQKTSIFFTSYLMHTQP